MARINIRDIVDISTTDLTEVNIKRDFDNPQKIAGYIPNDASRRTLKEIISGLMPTSTKRVHLITGSYGTGKSHFGLILSALLRKLPGAKQVLLRVRDKDNDVFQLVTRSLDATKKYLVIVPDISSYPNGFNRTLLLALHNALEKENIEFRPNSYYDAALKCIDRWAVEGSKSADDNPYKKFAKALIDCGKTPDILKDGLRKCSDTDLEIFKKVHEIVTYGAIFQPEASINPTDLYEEAVKYLRDKGNWEGVWVICDEFGRYLSELAKDPNSWESQNIQQFAEYCKRGGENQCHFVVIAHQTLADYATGFRDKKEWEKMAGRFIGNEYSLENISARYETVEMISSIITRKMDTVDQKQIWEKIGAHSDFQILFDDLKDAGIYSDQKQSWFMDTLLTGCFPLHPLTTYCLPLLAQKVGQRERTLFTFLNDDDKYGLRDFVNEGTIEIQHRLNLYTLDRILYYFEPAAENKSQYKQILQARREALSQVNDKPLARRIINSLTLFEIIGPENLKPTDSILALVLHLSPSEKNEIQQLLNELIDEKIIRRRSNGLLELRRRKGEFDITEAINKEKDELRPTFNMLETLANLEPVQQKLSSIEAYSYEKKHFIRRFAIRKISNPRSLSNPKEYIDEIEEWYKPNRKRYVGDALILYILAEGNNEIIQAKRYIEMDEYKYPQLIFAVPKEPIQLTETLLTLAATEEVKGPNKYPNKDDADIEELDTQIKDLQTEINTIVDNFLQANKLVWSCNGNTTSNLDGGGEEDFISNILENRFSKTPAVKDEAISNILAGRDPSKRDRHEVMTQLLEHERFISIKKTGGTAIDRILRNCLVDTEVLERKEDKGNYADYEVRSKLPKDAVLEDVWTYLSTKLFQQEHRIDLADIVNVLLQPPYGLSHQLIEILLASFFRNYLDEFVIFDNYQDYKKKKDINLLHKITLDAQAITLIVLYPDNYAAIYYEVRPTEREYVNRVIKRFATNEIDSGEMGIWDRGRDVLLKWFTALPPIATHANSYSSDLTIGLVDLLQDQQRITDAKGLFRNQLPSSLNVTFTSPPTESEIELLMGNLEICYLELENYADIKARALITELASIFNSTGITREELSIAIREWYNSKLSESQRLHIFGGDSGHFKKYVEAEGSIDKRMLEDLPVAMGLGSYKSWTENGTSDLFLTKIKLSKLEIEQWQSLPGPGTEKPRGPLQNRIDIVKEKILILLEGLELSNSIKKQILKDLLDKINKKDEK